MQSEIEERETTRHSGWASRRLRSRATGVAEGKLHKQLEHERENRQVGGLNQENDSIFRLSSSCHRLACSRDGSWRAGRQIFSRRFLLAQIPLLQFSLRRVPILDRKTFVRVFRVPTNPFAFPSSSCVGLSGIDGWPFMAFTRAPLG